MMDVFVPKNGAIVDIDSLQAIEDRSKDTINSLLLHRRINESIVLEGLEPNGKRAKNAGPPGVMQFSSSSFVLSAGKAVLVLESGKRFVVSLNESIELSFDSQSPSRRILGIAVEEQRNRNQEEPSASIQIRANIQMREEGEEYTDSMLILARELAPNIWTTDVQRLLQPENIVIQMIADALDQLEDMIWNSDRHGKPWNVQALGRDWKTYQTRAAVSVTGTRIVLCGRATSTVEMSGPAPCRPLAFWDPIARRHGTRH